MPRVIITAPFVLSVQGQLISYAPSPKVITVHPLVYKRFKSRMKISEPSKISSLSAMSWVQSSLPKEPPILDPLPMAPPAPPLIEEKALAPSLPNHVDLPPVTPEIGTQEVTPTDAEKSTPKKRGRKKKPITE